MAKFLIALGVLLTLHLASSNKLVCHMANWAQYRPGNGKFTPSNIDPFLCTHVIYSLATIDREHQITMVEWNDVEQYARLNSHKRVNPQLKTLLSVGGSVNGLSAYIPMTAKAESRAVFIKSAVNFLRKHNFDGLNIDWQYPAHNGGSGQDKERFTMLVMELSVAFENEARDNKRTQLLLSANVAAFGPIVDKAYEVNKITAYLDFLNIMTFDFHGSWEAVTGHNSPLFQSSVDFGSDIRLNINSSISHWLSLGAPSEKLLLGYPSYGRTFHLSGVSSSLGASADGPAEAGPYTRTEGFWAYYEVCSFLPGASVEWLQEQHVPYATADGSWVGYDDQRSYSSKVEWMTAHNLGGAHVWTLDMDDFTGSFCSEGEYPLINHLRMSMGFPAKPTTTPAPTTTRDPIKEFCRGRPNGLYENVADKTTYFQCFQGNTYLHHCQPGLIYWDSCKCCNWP